jgi:hypothetical protein
MIREDQPPDPHALLHQQKCSRAPFISPPRPSLSPFSPSGTLHPSLMLLCQISPQLSKLSLLQRSICSSPCPVYSCHASREKSVMTPQSPPLPTKHIHQHPNDTPDNLFGPLPTILLCRYPSITQIPQTTRSPHFSSPNTHDTKNTCQFNMHLLPTHGPLQLQEQLRLRLQQRLFKCVLHHQRGAGGVL